MGACRSTPEEEEDVDPLPPLLGPPPPPPSPLERLLLPLLLPVPPLARVLAFLGVVRECQRCRQLQPEGARTPESHRLPNSRWGWVETWRLEGRPPPPPSATSSSSAPEEPRRRRDQGSSNWAARPWVQTRSELEARSRRWRQHWCCVECWLLQWDAEREALWAPWERQREREREEWDQYHRYGAWYDGREGGWIRPGDRNVYYNEDCLTPRGYKRGGAWR